MFEAIIQNLLILMGKRARTIYRMAASSIFQTADSLYVFNCCHDINYKDKVNFWMVRFSLFNLNVQKLKRTIPIASHEQLLVLYHSIINFPYTGKNVIKSRTNFIILVLKSTKENNLPNGFG